MKPLRTAILGCGQIAHRHVHTLQSFKQDFEIVAFCNRNIEKAMAFSEKYTAGSAPVFSDHHEMFNQVGLDLVLITLPPYAHSDEVEVAAGLGVHVFIEKPVALASEQAWRMVVAAERAGIRTQVGFKLRFGAAVERMKALLDSGAAGRPGLMAGRYFCNSLHASWWRQREKSGGQLLEQAIHLIDLLRCLFGEPLTVYSRQANLFHQHVPDYTIEDTSASIFGFPSGALGVIYATNNAIPGRWISDFKLVTGHVTADFEDANHALLTYTNDPQTPAETVASERDCFAAELLDLSNAIRGGGETRIPLREGARSLDLALAAVRSAQERREVRLP